MNTHLPIQLVFNRNTDNRDALSSGCVVFAKNGIVKKGVVGQRGLDDTVLQRRGNGILTNHPN